MQRRLGALLTVSLLVPFLVVPAAASETITESYALGGFRILGSGPSFLWGGDLDGDGQDETPRLGGADLAPQQMYLNVIVSASDDIWGTDAGFIVRMWDPENDEIVQEPYSSGEGCGTRALLASPYYSNDVSVHMYSLVVMDTLEFCGATAGTVTGDFF